MFVIGSSLAGLGIIAGAKRLAGCYEPCGGWGEVVAV